ncbi:uncharacterized protein K444DRAFT_640673 [Hyaloscypha bicolor E]|uniref:BZIP domain-containing protein n=1 Tax=Hyaloscypha bicolor E TaxID=1095630 RepID=A0A2J6TPM1_9HELO|nr:uncharacterized protein K444DRAFT_640673 [Hyaloscypha bicolor E]PMD64963.1 hypothetical protein K444DRAFT_640673 [Hyaloscypha bicolor E]
MSGSLELLLPLVLPIARTATDIHYRQSWEVSGKRQCAGPRDRPGLGDQDSMSQRPPASRPASRSPPDGQRITLPPVQLRDDPPPGGRQGERHQQEPESRGYPQQLQSSPQHARAAQPAPSGEDWRSSGPSRDLGVHSMLNPAESEASGHSSRRRLSEAATESPVVGPASQFRASPVGMTAHPFSGQQPPSSTPPTTEAYSAPYPRNRRILTARSPSRTFSSGRGTSPATIDAQRSPFLPSRGRPYTAEPGPSPASEVPPMPTPPGQPQQQQQQQYGFPQSASTPTIAPRRASGSTMQAPGRAPASQSTSPSISASSHNPSSSQASPASFLYKSGQTPQTTTSYYPGSSYGTSMVQQQQQQGASRLADEKRARNAGASARFRQRRKEKEKEANSNIEKLQQQTRELERKVREVEQERDFYRAERDRFRDVVYRTPDMRHLVMQAPPSPQSMRPGSFQGSMSQMGNPPPPLPPSQMGFQAPESTSERAPRRRRTDAQGDFTSLPPYSLPPASTLPPVQASGYPPGPGQGPTSLPPLRIDNTAAPLTTSTSIPPATTAGPPPPYDPYSRGPFERGWPGEGGRRQ